ncbi:putative protein isoform X2 [Gossypium australe]|uniref:Uncharacterized protein n=1 Tax=Gossypium australe TaxID=47621 RepID=A0A5B6W7U0_9ROSI|nr:putative protein isoform X2 [Gossypium australe]
MPVYGAALLTARGTKRESPSKRSRRKPISNAKNKALSHALALATKASTTSSKGLLTAAMEAIETL